VHSEEAEQAVIGALLIDNESYNEISLTPEDFDVDPNPEIFKKIQQLHEDKQVYDAVILGHSFDEDTAMYLMELELNTVTSLNIGKYAKIIRDWAIIRGCREFGIELVHSATDPDNAAEIRLKASEWVKNLSQDSGAIDQNKIIHDVAERIKLYSSGEVPGIKTGFEGVDQILNPLEGGSLTVVAGRPAMGKTAFASQILMHHALEGLPVALFSLEMSSTQIMERNISNLGCVDLNILRNGDADNKAWCRIATAFYKLKDKPFSVEERARTVTDIKEKCYDIKREHGLGLICIDYLQLMSAGSAENRTTEISAISRGLKNLAVDLEVPVIALSQLNRGLEHRQDKRPMMADLRESGAIEQDADNIIFIYRDEVYNKFSADTGRVEIIISKQRNSPIGSTKMSFIGPFTRFEE